MTLGRAPYLSVLHFPARGTGLQMLLEVPSALCASGSPSHCSRFGSFVSLGASTVPIW